MHVEQPHNTKDLAKEILVEQQLPVTQTCHFVAWYWKDTMEDNGRQRKTMDDNERPWTTMDDNGRQWKTMDDNGRQWKTIKYNGRQSTCIVNAQVYLLVLLTNGAGAGAGAIATPQQ